MFNYVGSPKEICELESRTLERGRFYKLDDVWVPSVTTVIGHQSKAGILEWQKRVGFHEAEKIRMKSSWRGTKYHNLVEKYLRNEDVENRTEGEGLTSYLFRSARKDLDRITNIHLIEAPLFSRNLYLAGRVDCLAEFDGELAVIDFKTTRELKKPEWLENYFVQCSAYAYMYYEHTGIEVDKLVTISVSESGEMQVEQRYDKEKYVNKLLDYIKEYREYIESRQ
tara:strand:+ start:5977 stop:6651 length:675 start_codon:yes stop_codon:yes gene_type:complete